MIAARGLSHAFAGDDPVLRGVDFAVRQGERILVLGSNGCGKSTLLRILNGLIHPSAGEVSYEGRSLDRTTLRDRRFAKRFRGEVALLFQNPDAMIFNPTVRDEIAYGPRKQGRPDAVQAAEAMAEAMGIAHLLDRAPFLLSTGEKRKVCFAAVAVLRPRLLLLDEPTAGLDPRSTGWLVDHLQESPYTTITATHNLGLAAELGERALVLSEDHRLIHDGPIEDLLRNERVLVEANLVHLHRHRHGDRLHQHYHHHEWD